MLTDHNSCQTQAAFNYTLSELSKGREFRPFPGLAICPPFGRMFSSFPFQDEAHCREAGEQQSAQLRETASGLKGTGVSVLIPAPCLICYVGQDCRMTNHSFGHTFLLILIPKHPLSCGHTDLSQDYSINIFPLTDSLTTWKGH